VDFADDAQRAEGLFLAEAIDAARRCLDGVQVYRDGRVVCADCGEPIPPMRLQYLPGATRCRDCQMEREGERA